MGIVQLEPRKLLQAVFFLCWCLDGSKAAEARPPWLKARVSTWPEDRPAACTLSFDVTDKNATATVQDLLVNHDMRGSFFSTMDNASMRQSDFGSFLQYMLASGHEIGGRPLNKNKLTVEDVRLLNERMENTIKKDLPEGRTYSLPSEGSDKKQSVSKDLGKNVIAVRTVDSTLSSSSPADMLHISAFPIDGTSPERVQKAITNGQRGGNLSWIVFGDKLIGKKLNPDHQREINVLLWWLYKRTDLGEVWIDTFGYLARYVVERNNLEVSVSLESSGKTVRHLLSSICPELEGEYQSALSVNSFPIVAAVTLRMKKDYLPPEPVYIWHCVGFDLTSSPVAHAALVNCHLFRPDGNSRVKSKCRCRETNERDSNGHLSLYYTCCWQQLPRIGTEMLHMVLHRPCPVHWPT